MRNDAIAAIIKKGWTKMSMENVYGHCLVGAIRKVHPDRYGSYLDCLRCLTSDIKMEVSEPWETPLWVTIREVHQREKRLIEFNDDTATQLQDVLNLLR